jgi:hypothetical protein
MVRSFFFLKRFIAQIVYTVCACINYKIVRVTNLNIYTMVQVELNNGYVNIGANNGSEKL